MKWAGILERMGRTDIHIEFLVENPNPNNHLEDLGVIK
jgi:hypothetical protein